MAGTKAGGLKAKETIKQRHGSDFYTKLGAAGGKVSKKGGFAAMDKSKLKEITAKGGRNSTRTKNK